MLSSVLYYLCFVLYDMSFVRGSLTSVIFSKQ